VNDVDQDQANTVAVARCLRHRVALGWAAWSQFLMEPLLQHASVDAVMRSIRPGASG